jgi:ABC-type sugar transport system substrate-binding protein
MMKRIIVSVIVGLVLAANLAAGGGSQEGKQAQTPGNSKVRGRTIGHCYASSEAYYNIEINSVKWAVEKSGNTYTGRSAENNNVREIQNIENLISLGVDAILMHPTGSAQAQKAAQLANAANIPIFLIDSTIDPGPGQAQGAVGPDFLVIGNAVGEYVVKNKIGYPGGRFVVLGGLFGQSAEKNERESFMAAIAKDPAYKLLSAIQHADWDRKKGEDLMRNYLVMHNQIDLVFAMNEEMAAGGALAISESGRQNEMAMVSVNGSPVGEEMVRNGTLLATAKMSPSELGILATIKALEYINGTPEPYDTIQSTIILTKENVDKDGGGWEDEPAQRAYESIMKQKGYWN